MLDTRVTATTSTRPPDPEVEHVGVGVQTAWVQITTFIFFLFISFLFIYLPLFYFGLVIFFSQITTSPFTSCASLDNFLRLTILLCKMIRIPTSMVLFWEFNELTHMKHLNVSAQSTLAIIKITVTCAKLDMYDLTSSLQKSYEAGIITTIFQIGELRLRKGQGCAIIKQLLHDEG